MDLCGLRSVSNTMAWETSTKLRTMRSMEAWMLCHKSIIIPCLSFITSCVNWTVVMVRAVRSISFMQCRVNTHFIKFVRSKTPHSTVLTNVALNSSLALKFVPVTVFHYQLDGNSDWIVIMLTHFMNKTVDTSLV